MSLRRVALGTVCAQDRTSVRPGQGEDLPYLGLEGIESGTGQFVVGELSKTPEAPQANSFRFDERHVLYGKLRPYLNKVALPTAPGKCSTEIIPLLPTPPLARIFHQ
jgi:type I restriction enzyme S subunit